MRITITGGVRSGKSALASGLLETRHGEGNQIICVVFGQPGLDPEFDARINRHQIDRPVEYRVIVGGPSDAWVADIDPGSVVMVDCIGSLLGLLIDSTAGEVCGPDYYDLETLPVEVSDLVEARLSAIIGALCELPNDMVFVTNEVGLSPVAPWASARLFVDVLGRINRQLVSLCDSSYLCVAGRAIPLHTHPTTIDWTK